jgi:hypothetical protein
MSDRIQSDERAEQGEYCSQCGVFLPEGSPVCLECGAAQPRVCFCGATLDPDMPECPECGAQWARVIRIRRRSRSSRVRSDRILRSAGIGALVAVMGGALLNIFISGLAERSTPDGVIPENLWVRTVYAWYTLGTAVQALIARLGGLRIGWTLVLAVMGALGGALWYLAEIGRLRGGGKRSRGSRRHRSERRA